MGRGHHNVAGVGMNLGAFRGACLNFRRVAVLDNDVYDDLTHVAAPRATSPAHYVPR
jgi:hypothetical protein